MDYQGLVSQLRDILPDEREQRILAALKQNDYDIEKAAEALMTGTVVWDEQHERINTDDNISADKTKLNPKHNGRSKTPERKRTDPANQKQSARYVKYYYILFKI